MNILGISGSLRSGSFNTMLVRAAAERFGGATLTMADLNIPLYDGDVEAEGMPAAVTALVERTASADAVLISTPEYNKGIPGVLKNALDWMSRVKPMPLTGKPTAIMSAAAGRGGGEVAQFMLRHCLVSHGPRLVMGPMVAVGGAQNAFADGKLTDEMALKVIDQQMEALKALMG